MAAELLVTGATGMVGNAIARALVARGRQVRALVRDPERARAILPPEVELVRGDVTRPDSLGPAMAGVRGVFHAAGMPEQWQADPGVFDQVNRQGTANVIDAAIAAGVERVVYTSTMDVFAAPRGGRLDESQLDPNPKPSAYERSKQEAEREAVKRGERIPIVYVNPSAVYGPGPVHVGLNSFFIKLLTGQLPALPPGGMSICFSEAVAEAHVAAFERGEPGRRYLLADAHVSSRDLAEAIARQVPVKVPPVAPEALMNVLAAVSEPLARLFGFTPLVAAGQLHYMLWDAHVDASRARAELGYAPVALEEGVARTVACLREQDLVPR